MSSSRLTAFRRGGRIDFGTRWVGYALALASVTAALVLRRCLDPFLGDHQPYGAFYIAVVLTVRLSGWQPGLLAMILGALASSWFFAAPRHSFLMSNSPTLIAICVYLGVALAMLSFSWRRRSALHLAKVAALRFEQLQAELTDLSLRLQATLRKSESLCGEFAQDLRAPVMALQGFAQVLLYDCRERLGAQEYEYVRQIMAAAKRLDRLIEDRLRWQKERGSL